MSDRLKRDLNIEYDPYLTLIVASVKSSDCLNIFNTVVLPVPNIDQFRIAPRFKSR
jgi:hypothetical protein